MTDPVILQVPSELVLQLAQYFACAMAGALAVKLQGK